MNGGRVRRRVLYVRDDDGHLVEEVTRAAGGVRQRTGKAISTASVARNLLREALESPTIRRRAGIPPR